MQPLTAAHLRKFATSHLGIAVASGTHKTTWLALLLIWNLFLRVSEILPKSPVRYYDWTLRVRDVWVQRFVNGTWTSRPLAHWDKSFGYLDRIVVSLRGSKTDRSHRGFRLAVTRTNTRICPVVALHRSLMHCGAPTNPDHLWFPRTTSAALGRLIKLISKSLKLEGNYNTHSLRAGAATSLLLAGAPPRVIMLMGRWKSEAYRRYLRVSITLAKTEASWLLDNSSTHSKMQNAPGDGF